MRRRTLLATAGAGTLAALGAPTAAYADYSTTINPSTTWGTWQGWGTSLCWWGKAYGNSDSLADLIFTTKSVSYNGKTLPGLGLTIARYNAGACSWNSISGESMVVSANMNPARQIEGFWLDWNSTDPSSSSWTWSVDANQRAMLQKAVSRGATAELFSNSPMWWMCVNHNPSGSANGTSDNLQSWNYQQHAVYLATVAKYYHDHYGVTFASVEAFNEPMSSWWTAAGTQEGCHFNVATQAAVIPYLRSELDSRGLTSTIVSASDETSYDLALSTWNSLGSTAQGVVKRVNVHGYQYGGGRRDLLYSAVHGAGKALWNSEYGESDGTGLSLASNLILDLRWLHPTAWVYWQAFDGGGWGLIQADESAGTLGAVNTKYYVLAQFARHIRPGMTIIDGGESNTVAAYDSANKRLVIVTANYGTAQKITYDLSKYGTVGGASGGLVRRWATNTAGSGDLYTAHTDTYLSGKSFSSSFTANTIQTFEIDNVS